MSNPDSTAPPRLDYFTPESKTVCAGFWLRFAAFLIDFTVVLGVLGPVAAMFEWLAATQPLVEWTVTVSLLGELLALIAISLYFSLMESSVWQATLGKLLVGVQVVDLQGRRLSFGRASGRFWAKLFSALPFYMGFFAIAWDEEKQGFHDVIAETRVIQRRPRA